MPPFTIAIADTIALGTQVAVAGALRVDEPAGDQVFEMLIAIAILIYEMAPG